MTPTQLLLLLLLLFIYLYEWVTSECGCTWRQEVIRSHRCGITGGCEVPGSSGGGKKESSEGETIYLNCWAFLQAPQLVCTINIIKDTCFL